MHFIWKLAKNINTSKNDEILDNKNGAESKRQIINGKWK